MEENPLVSVILTVYNGERFLRQAIDSVLNQSYDNIQLIIADDFSTDKSREIINSYSDSRIIKVLQECNKTVCVNINTALKNMSGDYLATMAHDDVWAKDKIERQLEYMQTHPECGVCFTKCNVIDQDNNIINERHPLYHYFEGVQNADHKEFVRKLFFEGNQLCATSALIRVKGFEEELFYKNSLLQLQDYELWIRLITKKEMHIMNEHLVNYRQILDTNENLSTVTPQSASRTAHEGNYIADRYIYSLADKDFKDIFQPDFVCPEADTADELLCERMWMLKRANNFCYLNHYMDLMNKEETRKIMEERYNVTLKDFYELNGSYIFWEQGIYNYLSQLENTVTKYKEIAEKQQKILVQQEQEIKKLRHNL